MQRYDAHKGDNPNYWIHIECRGHGFEVVCDMPEQISIGVASEWESRLPHSLAEMIGIGNLAASLGENTIAQDLSYQVWMGSTPIEIPITILFDSYESAKKDVYDPINMIMAAAQPVNMSGGLLRPPGPKRGGENYGINIRFGRMMHFMDCIIVSATETFDTRLDRDGFPIAGELEVTFRTSIVYGFGDWMRATNLSGR